ncbi:MAG: glycosyltransferase [Chloroflexales bacterium]|nr:glycosyltransferase [Chloroflexales bacterium]
MADTPLVSIIIRARNEAPALQRLLPILARQQADFGHEVWLLDNASDDGTAEIARAHGANYHFIPRDAFNYSSALNLGASLARGSIVVNLSAHCFPASDTWLAALVEPLRTPSDVIATYGRQRNEAHVAPFEALGNDSLFPAAGAAPSMVVFSNANCAIRKDYLLLHPFNPAIKILEDHLFYLELSGEYRFAYVPEALVAHEHERFSWRYYARRWAREGWSFFFLRNHRGLASPFVQFPFLIPRNLFYHYPKLAGWFAKRGEYRTALLTLPFFWLRDAIWFAGWLRARVRHPRLSQEDTSLLLRTNLALMRRVLSGGGSIAPVASWNAPTSWPEEWQLKADWPFIRQNIADFIRSCHERGLIAGPLLEVGAAGQNDYLGEFYEMITSNLDYNLQGSDTALDMEDMRGIASASLGTVLCSEVIEHVRHPDRAAAEAFRTLRPAGTLIVTTPYSIVIHNTEDDGGFHGRNFTPQGLELVLREAGFEIVCSETRGTSDTRRRLMPSNVFVVGRKA